MFPLPAEFFNGYLKTIPWLSWFLVAAFVLETEADVIYVKPASSPPHDGRSWLHAFETIGQAIQAARPGDQIWVAKGIYRESNLIGKAGIDMMGGFLGTENSLEERDWINHPAILEGNSLDTISSSFYLDGFVLQKINGASIRILGQDIHFRHCDFRDNRGEPAGVVYCESGALLSFDECTFENNHSSEASAVSIQNATVVFRDCSFVRNGTGNATPETSALAVVVGRQGASIGMFDSRMEGNQGRSAGGLYGDNCTSIHAENCTFLSNNSLESGGAIAARTQSFQLNECHFERNTAMKTGGALALYHSFSKIRASTFTWNRCAKSKTAGGGVYFRGGESIIENCEITQNRADVAGGAASIDQNLSIFSQCRISDNASITQAGGLGGSLTKQLVLDGCRIERNFCHHSGAGVFALQTPKLNIFHSTFERNHVLRNSNRGAGLSLHEVKQANIVQCTFDSNTLNERNTAGGGLEIDNSTVHVYFSVFFNNSATLASDIAVLGKERFILTNCTLIHTGQNISCSLGLAEETNQSVIASDSQSMLRNNILWGYQFPVLPATQQPGKNVFGSISSGGLPNFPTAESLGMIDWLHGDVRLHPNSPLIDAGQGSENIGELQPYDGNHDGLAIWDIGAFEYRGDR